MRSRYLEMFTRARTSARLGVINDRPTKEITTERRTLFERRDHRFFDLTFCQGLLRHPNISRYLIPNPGRRNGFRRRAWEYSHREGAAVRDGLLKQHCGPVPTTCVSSRDNEERAVMELLARWARFLSINQVASLFDGNNPTRRAERLARRLESQGLVSRRRIIARPSVPAVPLLVFKTGQQPPDFSLLSSKCRARWGQPTRSVDILQLTADGAKAMGAFRPRKIRKSEATHDLQMAEVAIAFWKRETVAEWLRDDALSKAKRWGQIVPDAEVCFKGGGRAVVECGGTYSAQKLGVFHDAVTSRMQELSVGEYQVF